MQASFDCFDGTDSYIVSPSSATWSTWPWPWAAPLGQGRARHRQDPFGPQRGPGPGHGAFIWNIKSTTKAQDGLYVYDTVQRLNDSRFGGGM
jgi:hypothetical protein